MQNKDENINENDDVIFEETTEMGDEKTLKDKLKDLQKKLKEKTDEAKENLDGWQRARAELVNKDKQIQNERIEIYKNASANLLEEIIPALDSFEMAKKNKEAWESVPVNWRSGVEYIFQQLLTAVENAGLKKIEPKEGDLFDLNKMQSIEEVETNSGDLDHMVCSLVQSGYELNGKLLREAKVKIFIRK